MDKILILHGPNLNLLGRRETAVYGTLSYDDLNDRLIAVGKELDQEIRIQQSNHEGELIDALHDSSQWASGVILNPGGYTHTSIALRDAVSALEIPVIEVHMSNIFAREKFRHRSFISPVAAGTIAGFGWQSYVLGIQALVRIKMS